MKQNVKLYKSLCFIIKPFLKIFYPYEVRGKENIENLSGGYILCSNHLSNIDAVFLALEHKKPICFMAKAELFKNKILGGILKAIGAFPVDRGKGDKEAIITAKEVINEGKVLGIFLEGKRSKTGELLRPRSGVSVLAHDTGADILPVNIVGENGGRVRMFRRTVVTFGSIMSEKDLGIEKNEIRQYRIASNKIMDKIREMREEYLKGRKITI